MARLTEDHRRQNQDSRTRAKEAIAPIKSNLMMIVNNLHNAPASHTLANELDGIIGRLEAFQQKL